MSKIETLLKDNEHIYPRTVEKAIYDDNGVRLDNKIGELSESVSELLCDTVNVSGITDNNGFLNTNISTDKYIESARLIVPSNGIVFWHKQSSGFYSIRIVYWDLSPQSNIQVNCSIKYLKN